MAVRVRHWKGHAMQAMNRITLQRPPACFKLPLDGCIGAVNAGKLNAEERYETENGRHDIGFDPDGICRSAGGVGKTFASHHHLPVG